MRINMKCISCNINKAEFPDSDPRYCGDCWNGLSDGEQNKIEEESEGETAEKPGDDEENANQDDTDSADSTPAGGEEEDG
jgi:hypothetical protein